MKSFVQKILAILLGSIICSFAYNSFLMPNHLLVGGISGISLLGDYFLNFPVYLGIILLNIPTSILGFKYLDKSKMFYTIGCVLISAFFIPLLAPLFPKINVDIFLSSVFGGIINGLGCGIILKSGCTSGGTDVLGTIAKNKFNISIGSFSLMFNSVLVAVFLCFNPVEIVLYSLISMFFGSKIIDIVVTGIVKNKSVTIISEKSDEIKERIFSDIHRGVTVYSGYGGYTNNSQKILNCIISHQQVPALKELVFSIDSKAFVYIAETVEVNGNFKS